MENILTKLMEQKKNKVTYSLCSVFQWIQVGKYIHNFLPGNYKYLHCDRYQGSPCKYSQLKKIKHYV